MSFIINRKALLDELILLQAVAEKKPTIPVLSTVRMVVADDMVQLTATDLDMSLTAQVPAAGDTWAGCVPSKQLYELARLLTGNNIEIEPRDNERIQIKCGRSKHLLPIFPVGKFPAVEQPSVTTAVLSGGILSTAIARAAACITPDAVDYWMQGVALRSHEDGLYVVASNSRQTAISVIPASVTVDVSIPVRAANALVKLLGEGDVAFGVADNQAVFQQGKRTFCARLLTAQFPDWRPLVPATWKHNLTLEPDSAQQAFRLAAVTAWETALIPIPLRLVLSQTQLKVETRESERGQSSEVLGIDCASLNGDEMSIGINGAHFIGFLNSDSKTIVSFNDNPGPIQLSYEGEPSYWYITMALKA